MAECLRYTTWADWVDRAESESRLKQFAPGDDPVNHPRICKAELAAVNTMEDSLRKRGFRLPLDPPLAEHVVQHLLSVGFEFLTMRSENKVDSIDKNAKLARTFFKEVATGRNSLTDADSTTPQIAENVDFMFRQPLAIPEDEDSILPRRMPPL